MPARAYWQGQIRLALVSIPVQVFTATKSAARVSFNQIHKPSGKRIRYEKVVPGVGAVNPDEIVKGYEVEKGQYVLLDDDEIEGVKLEAKHTIDLVQFVDADEVDPIYFEKPYFVMPDEDDVAAEAYVVLRDALKATRQDRPRPAGRARPGEYRGAETHGQGPGDRDAPLCRRAAEAGIVLRDGAEREAGEGAAVLATELIQRKAKPFDPKAFKDQYDVALRELIDAKIEHRKPREIEAPQLGAKVINLMDALKKSIGSSSASASSAKGKTPAKKRAAAAETAHAPRKTSAKKTTAKPARRTRAA